METFPSYPAGPSGMTDSPEDRYVIVATPMMSSQTAKVLRTGPLTAEVAQHVMAEIAAGRPTDFLLARSTWSPRPGRTD